MTASTPGLSFAGMTNVGAGAYTAALGGAMNYGRLFYLLQPLSHILARSDTASMVHGTTMERPLRGRQQGRVLAIGPSIRYDSGQGWFVTAKRQTETHVGSRDDGAAFWMNAVFPF